MRDIRIPQNVQIADKLIGPLSLKQIIMIAIGGGFSYALYGAIQKSMGYVPIHLHALIWLPVIFAAAFALVRINDISLFRYCLLILELLSKPRERCFLPRQGIVLNIQTRISASSAAKKKHEAEAEETLRPQKTYTIDDLSIVLDAEGKEPVSVDPLETNVDGLSRAHS